MDHVIEVRNLAIGVSNDGEVERRALCFRYVVRPLLMRVGRINTETNYLHVAFVEFGFKPRGLAQSAPDPVLAQLRNAGTVFVGAYASVAYGDYMTGANHVLPTGGLARSYSGLSTLDFFRWTTYQRVTRDAAARLSEDVGVFADAERLGGHALAARAWRQAALV